MSGLEVAISYGPLNPQLGQTYSLPRYLQSVQRRISMSPQFGQWNFAEPMSSGGILRWHDEHAPVDIELLTTIPLVQ